MENMCRNGVCLLPILSRLLPQTLKYRLVAAFTLLILLPFSVLEIYNFQKVKLNLQQKTSEQSLAQLGKMNESLDSLLATAFKSVTMFEQDSTVAAVLKQPEAEDLILNLRRIEERFRTVTNSLFISSPPVFYTIADLHGHVYTSYQPARILNYADISEKRWFKEALMASAPYSWRIEPNFVLPDISISPDLLGIAAPLRDADGKIYAIVHAAVDYHTWFKSATKGSLASENYYLVDLQGKLLVRSGTAPDSDLPGGALEEPFLRSGEEQGFMLRGDTFMNYTLVPSFHAYLVKTIPSAILFAELKAIQNSYMVSLALFTLAFIVITFILASAVTRPLLLIQSKMLDVVRKDLKVRIPDLKYRGEILDIAKAFNKMVADMDGLIHRLKQEERQKEANRFQMLLSQMNPHFLLNTLNTIRWLALERNDPSIPQICMSLGRLTEAGLKLDVDLIHLEQELELVRGHVYIQQFRYDQQFRVTYDYPEHLRYALVPKLSLQPLVENSIYHGISQIPEEGWITVRVYQSEAQLIMEVEDNGVGWRQEGGECTDRVPNQGHVPNPGQHNGIALQNLKERLLLLFKQEAGLDFIPAAKGCLVRIRLPLLLSAPYAKGGDADVEGTSG